MGGAAGTNGKTLCPSSPHFLDPSTADAPGGRCLPCATVSSSSAPQGLILTLQPEKHREVSDTDKTKTEMGKICQRLNIDQCESAAGDM